MNLLFGIDTKTAISFFQIFDYQNNVNKVFMQVYLFLRIIFVTYCKII
jgi:hypothetical protein